MSNPVCVHKTAETEPLDTPDSNNPDQNIINPVLNIYPPVKDPFSGNTKPGKEGVAAWIDPPYVDIGYVDTTSASPSDQYRSARFNVPLKCGWVDFQIDGDVERGFFANWIMSWSVNLGSQAISDIEKRTYPSILVCG